LLNTGVENGFIIFLIATDVLDSWSFAELILSAQRVLEVGEGVETRTRTNQTRPNAPIPTGWRSTYRVVTSKT
jgi:hypothetical protein